MSTQSFNPATPAPSRCREHSLLLCLAIALMTQGCSALHPLRGVPAAYLPEAYEGPSRDNQRTIDLSLLVQTPPDQYRVAAGDVLSIYIPTVLGAQPTGTDSVGIDPPINMPFSDNDPPTVGFPWQVRDDNTISLPQIPPINVGGMTLHEVEQTVRKAYIKHKILQPDEAMVIVSLQRPRNYRVLVVRQEPTTALTTAGTAGSVNIGSTDKGTARTVTLKAYENDVLHALAMVDGADGLPGLNAENTIYIIRRRPRLGYCDPLPHQFGPADWQGVPGQEWTTGQQDGLPAPDGPHVSARVSHSGIQQVSAEVPASATAVWSGAPRPQPTAPAQTSPYGSYRSAAAPAMEVSHSLPQQSSRVSSGHSFSHAGSQAIGHSLGAQTSHRQVRPANFDGHAISPMDGHSISPPPVAKSKNPQPKPVPSPAPIPDTPPHLTGPALHAPPVTYDAPSQWAMMLDHFDPTIDNPNVIKIPVRLAPGEVPHITDEMITLHDGDIVFIENRLTEVFYTGGLLGGGQYTLPRDYDLRVLEAVSIAEGRSQGSGQIRAVGGVSALNKDVSNSASRLAILRMLPNGKRITIEVDLHKAMRYQEENIIVQPGDMLILEYTMPEAVCAFTQRFLLEGALIGIAASAFTGGGGN